MPNNKLPRRVFLSIFLSIFVFSFYAIDARADIFGGDGGGSSGFFGGIADGVTDFFNRVGEGFRGGAVIDPPPPADAPAPAEVPGALEDMPPDPASGSQLKLTWEWDSQSLGGEAVEINDADPLACYHLGEDWAVLLGYDHCAGTGYPGMGGCGPCGVNEGETISNQLVLDSTNRVIPQRTFDLMQQIKENLPSLDQEVRAEIPNPPNPNPPPGGTTVVDPIVWTICTVIEECHEEDYENVLVGWCGDNPPKMPGEDRINEFNADAEANEEIPIPVNATGPNSFTLPNAVSNKFVRRDGYMFTCVTTCDEGECEVENYIEFQTMIFPSNAVSMYLRAENVGEFPLENVVMRFNTLSFSSGGETPLPHNLDVYANYDGSFDYYGSAPGALNNWGYIHAQEIPEVIQAPSDPAAYNLGVDVQTSAGADIAWQVGPRTGTEGTAQPEWQFYTAPFSLAAPEKDPATGEIIAPGESIEIPLQHPGTELIGIPSSAGTSALTGFEVQEIAKPCECQSVRLHRTCGAADDGCGIEITNPSIDQCRLYYGIGMVVEGKDYRDEAGGLICDILGIPVEGCPPPWCFEGAISEHGPLNMCRPNPGSKISNPQDGGDTYWMFNCDLTPYEGAEAETTEFSFSNLLRKIVPGVVYELLGIDPADVFAVGCAHPCDNQPPSGLQGVGAMIPRDYNFICSNYDENPLDPNQIVEQPRCDGSDYTDDQTQTLIPPVLDAAAWVAALPNQSQYELFRTYRDVTGLGGCGYQASSNNSVIGPMQFTAEWGGEGEDRTGRSVLVGSIPIGGMFIDDHARPYGWPMSGVLQQDWGPVSTAQGQHASSPWKLGNEYRYCSPDEFAAPPPTDPAVLGCPQVELPDICLTGDPSCNAVDQATLAGRYPSRADAINECYNYIVQQAVIKGFDPALTLAIWLEESGASDYASYPGVADFGCTSSPRENIIAQLQCFLELQDYFLRESAYQPCAYAREPEGYFTPREFLQLFAGGLTACLDDNFGERGDFYATIDPFYRNVHRSGSGILGAIPNNEQCVLPWSVYDDTCANAPATPE